MKKLIHTLVVMCLFVTIGHAQLFSSKKSISSTGNSPFVIKSGNLDNDDFPDILIGTLGGTVEWYKNNGNDTFSKQANISSTLSYVKDVAIADLDGDSKNDVIAISNLGNLLVWYKNNGNGTFGAQQIISASFDRPIAIKTGKIDGNNSIDVAVAEYDGNQIVWFSNNGSGTFGSAQIVTAPPVIAKPRDIDLADFDKDGDLDLVVAYYQLNGVYVYYNDRVQNGSVSFTNLEVVGQSISDLRTVSFNDIDGDNNLDVLVVASSSNTIRWYERNGTGSYTAHTLSASSSPVSAMVGDLDKDSKMDIVASYASASSTDKLSWFKSSNPGVFSGESIIDNSQDDIMITLADFDKDGDLDVASISINQGVLSWFENTGNSQTCLDSDSDGVCDSVDQCPGFDDRIDTNGNGIPDGCESTGCTQNTTNFAVNPLTLVGLGSSSTTINFPDNSENVEFTITNIDANLKGKASNQFNEEVIVTYKDGSGNNKTYNAYYGSSVSSANISINGKVQSVTVALRDFLGGTSSNTLSITLGQVTYCGTAAPPPCPDADGDGVCDANDQCPGFNDNIDNNNNGIPDGCESICTSTSTAQFNKNPLTHARIGSNSAMVSLPAGSKNPSFNIYDLDAQVSGKPANRFIENVVVKYIDGAGATKTLGTYSGADMSTATINISGIVSSITVSLSDELNSGTTISVNFSDVTYCIGGSSTAFQGSTKESSQGEIQSEELSISNESDKGTLKIYPNPASKVLYIKSSKIVDKAYVSLFSTSGTQVRQYKIDNIINQTYDINIEGLATGLYVLRIVNQKGDLLITERIVIK